MSLIPYSYWGGINEVTMSTGLKGARFNGYFADDVYWFSTAQAHGDVDNNRTQLQNFTSSADNYSWQWLGYFLAPVSGIYTFYTVSDDASYLWIGNNARNSFYTAGNALVNNGGLHGLVEVSGTISLERDKYYLMRVQFGEQAGGDEITVYFQGPGINKTSNGSGYYFGGQETYPGNDVGVVDRYDEPPEIPPLPTNGMVLHLDAGNSSSYPGSGSTWSNLANGNFTTTLVPLSGGAIEYTSADNGRLYFSTPNGAEKDRADVTTTLTQRQTWNSYWASSREMTVLAVIRGKFIGYTSVRDAIIGQRYFFGVGFGFHIHCNSNQIRRAPSITMPYSTSANNFQFFGDGFNVIPSSGPAWENYDSKLVFLAFNHNGDTRQVRYALNDSIYATDVPQFTPANTYMTDETNNVQIGVFADAGGWDNMYIHKLVVYNRALADNEILDAYDYLNQTYNFEQTHVTDQILLYLDATNTTSYPTSGTIITDISGNGSTITMNSSGYYNTTGAYFSFSASDSTRYFDINIAGINSSTPLVTVEMWVRPTDTGALAGMFFGFPTYDLYRTDQGIGFNTGGSDLYGITPGNLPSGFYGNWHHIVCVMHQTSSYTNNKIYIDGTSYSLSQILASEVPSNRDFISGSFRVSSWRTNTNYPYTMDVSIVRVYNKELSLSEIQNNYNYEKFKYNIQ